MTTATDKQPLTARQREVLDFISCFIDTRGYSPSVRDIANAYGWTTNGVMCHLRPMRRKGWVTWVDGCSRTLRVIGGDA